MIRSSLAYVFSEYSACAVVTCIYCCGQMTIKWLLISARQKKLKLKLSKV